MGLGGMVLYWGGVWYSTGVGYIAPCGMLGYVGGVGYGSQEVSSPARGSVAI